MMNALYAKPKTRQVNPQAIIDAMRFTQPDSDNVITWAVWAKSVKAVAVALGMDPDLALRSVAVIKPW